MPSPALVYARLAWRKLAAAALVALLAETGVLLAAGLIESLAKAAYLLPLPQGLRGGVVVTGYSVAPYTSMINIVELEKRLRGIDAEVVPLVLVPAETSNGGLVLVLGVPDSVLRGLGLRPCSGCLYVGRGFAERTGLRSGLAVLDSVFSKTSIPVKIVVAEGLRGCTAVTDIETARLIRGIPWDKASLAIIKPRGPEAARELAKRLGLGWEKNLLRRVAYVAMRGHGFVAAKTPEQIYLERIGLEPRLVAGLGALAGALLILLIYALPGFAASIAATEARILIHLGASVRGIRAASAAAVVLGASLAPLATHALASYASGLVGVVVTGCPVAPVPGLVVELVLLAASALVAAMGAMRVEVEA